MNTADEPEDPYLWLEEVDSEAALTWVREHNAATLAELTAQPAYATVKPRLRAVLDAQDRIPQVARRGAWLYNVWQDEAHPRGLWRRTSMASYREAEPAWQTLIDLDALAAAEGENWVWKGATCLPPSPGQP